MNVLKTALLLSALTALLIFIGGLLGGHQGAMAMFIIALLMNLVSYWFSDKIVLAMHRAKPLNEADAPHVYRAVREIASRDRLPMPKLYWIGTKTPNAFATGRSPKHAAVAVTSGLLEIMNEEELKGVLAHELSHVKNRDTLVMCIAAAIAGAIMMLARMAQWSLWMGGGRSRDSENRSGAALQLVAMLLVAILAPLAAMLIQLAISRTREYGADATGAHLTGNPHGLASALEKLHQATRDYPLPNANPATAHLFIVNPLSAGAIAGLFSTHPPVAERVRRLRSMRL
ncbi:MAG: zinc metalloprotease HtpX [Candidatus Omnitrophica bacterium]|nr:zinc metalloprotease HtpX [Candidatus Omnitrophota bacterium]